MARIERSLSGGGGRSLSGMRGWSSATTAVVAVVGTSVAGSQAAARGATWAAGTG